MSQVWIQLYQSHTDYDGGEVLPWWGFDFFFTLLPEAQTHT